jgi:hypothetical protein
MSDYVNEFGQMNYQRQINAVLAGKMEGLDAHEVEQCEGLTYLEQESAVAKGRALADFAWRFIASGPETPADSVKMVEIMGRLANPNWPYDRNRSGKYIP